MAALHPQVVHFTIVLVIVGVAFRLVSLLGRRSLAFTGPAATTLLLLAALSGVVSAQSGTAAHGPVERAPGARAAVTEHEEWGERTQIVLLVLGGIELAAIFLRRSPRVRIVKVLAALVGIGAVVSVYETAEHGGELVYAYAGGVGIRSGDPQDVERLLLAGYYQQAMVDRQAGRSAQAAELVAAAAKRFPSNTDVQLLAAESQLTDLKNPQRALELLSAVSPTSGNRFMVMQKANLEADAYVALGQKDKAIAALEAVTASAPNPRLQQRIEALKK